jgi:hypothetical protein
MPKISPSNVSQSVRPHDPATWPQRTEVDGAIVPAVSLELDGARVRLVRELRCDGVPVLSMSA